jgi:hypothetical protein
MLELLSAREFEMSPRAKNKSRTFRLVANYQGLMHEIAQLTISENMVA